MTFIDGETYLPQPTLDGMIPGIIATHPSSHGRTGYTVQCASCGLVEVLDHLVLATIDYGSGHHHGIKRRCRNCKLAANPDCTCIHCHYLRTGSYSR